MYYKRNTYLCYIVNHKNEFYSMNGNVSILSVVPVEQLSVSRYAIEMAFMLATLSYEPKLLGAFYGAMALTAIDRLRSAEFKELGNPLLRMLCYLDVIMGAVLTVGLLWNKYMIIGAGFLLYALTYGIRSAMSQQVSSLLSTFHLITCMIGCVLSYLYFTQVDVFKVFFGA